ncbi:MAG: asparagine synthase (glutamine-hydrolyzing) [Sphingopyxis sp.]
MCGIAGIFSYLPSTPMVDEGELTRIRDHMAARGPDGFANWIGADRRIGLAHRRLAIIDLTDGGFQPMSDGGALTITFNGEIYNYRELRVELEAKGQVFHTASDTEVILRGFAVEGPAIFARLRGMFACAIWDANARKLTMARDGYGIKPLYYADSGGAIRFASSVKALLAGGQVSREPDHAGRAGFYLLGSVPEPFTSFDAISALPAGCWATCDANGLNEPQSHTSIARIYQHAEAEARELHLSHGEAAEIAHAALLDSVRHHLIADVPVATFLSAGIDSGAILGLACQAGAGRIAALTLGFGEYVGLADDERTLAGVTAAHYGVAMRTRTVDRSEFHKDADAILAAMDQPSIDGPNSWFISKFAREQGYKAALSGLGGDELLGGYPSFQDVPRWARRMGALHAVPILSSIVNIIGPAEGAARLRLKPKALGLLRYGSSVEGAYFVRRGLYMPWELDAIMGREAAQAGRTRLDLLPRLAAMMDEGSRNMFARIATLESSQYMRNQLLRDADWASMAHSLEIRVPLVDTTLLKVLAPLMLSGAIGNGKALLASAPQKPLPDAIISRTKTGFSIPVGQWMGMQTAHKRGNPPSNPYAYTRNWARRVGQIAFDG